MNTTLDMIFNVYPAFRLPTDADRQFADAINASDYFGLASVTRSNTHSFRILAEIHPDPTLDWDDIDYITEAQIVMEKLISRWSVYKL